VFGLNIRIKKRRAKSREQGAGSRGQGGIGNEQYAISKKAMSNRQ
jgi:hypothetical protein